MNLKTKKFDIKKINLKNIKFFEFFKNKYNYDITKVIGVKNKERYILYTDKKLLRIYRDNLKSSALLSTYIPIEDAIFYNFIIEKSIIEKIDIKTFIETKAYEEAGLSETEKYIIKYKIIDKLNDEKEVLIQTVIISENYINQHYQSILEETGYIDYISFPAFAYKSLYDEEILKKADDVFVVILFDKIFLTFYSEGELLYINTISGGFNTIYKELEELKIKNLDLDLFKKLLTKKGISPSKYISKEKIIYERIKRELTNKINLINEQILSVMNTYDVMSIDRIFITSEYGFIPGINEHIENTLNIKSFSFDFYEKYNLDRLAVDPFLFLAMIETHHSYKVENLTYNYSLFLRKPRFIYRKSGILITSAVGFMFLFSSYPLYLYIKNIEVKKELLKLETKVDKLSAKENHLKKEVSKKKKVKKTLKKNILSYKMTINKYKDLISTIYKFKFSYIPKSQELVDLTLLMNKYDIYLTALSYEDKIYTINIYSYNSNKLGNFIDSLVSNGFNIYFDSITKKDGKYSTIIRIEE